MRIKSLLLFIVLTMAAVFVSCDTEDDRELFFVGDSLVARWDLKYWFPSYITHNDGVSGSGIDYIEMNAGGYDGHDVVIIVGTNDLGGVSVEQEDEYVARYVNAVVALKSRRAFLFSIFPRGEDWWDNDLNNNERIKRVNGKIKSMCDNRNGIVYVDVYGNLEQDGVLKAQYTYDGLHLSQEGYELITKKLKDVL